MVGRRWTNACLNEPKKKKKVCEIIKMSMPHQQWYKDVHNEGRVPIIFPKKKKIISPSHTKLNIFLNMCENNNATYIFCHNPSKGKQNMTKNST